jgi:hypothetical protein
VKETLLSFLGTIVFSYAIGFFKEKDQLLWQFGFFPYSSSLPIHAE